MHSYPVINNSKQRNAAATSSTPPPTTATKLNNKFQKCYPCHRGRLKIFKPSNIFQSNESLYSGSDIQYYRLSSKNLPKSGWALNPVQSASQKVGHLPILFWI